MSTLTTTTVNTIDGTTNLTLQTGNSAAARIILGSAGGITLGANSSANVIIVSPTLVNVTANANMLTVNASALNLSGASIGTSGYSRLPNGLLLQWGTVVANTISGTITFPLAFAAAPYSVVLTGGASVTSVGYVNAISTTTATIRSTSTQTPAGNTYYYMALGV